MKRIVNFFWPLLGKTALSVAEVEADLKKDLDDIRSATWKKLPNAIEHARQLTEVENGRKQSADSKGSLYLAVIAAIVPILGSLVTDFYRDASRQLGDAFGVVTLLLFVVGMAYLVACGIWSFRTLKVSNYVRVDVAEFVAASTSRNPEEDLVKEMLCAVRMNREEVNAKTSCIRMAHEFLVRTFLSFSILLLVIVLWNSVIVALDGSTAIGARFMQIIRAR
ncbi:hypothetical protein B5V01_21890 [Mesorhizobium erdmanii]|uniref:Uncharacterized protein n=2 Tax=Mesorhizobium TaxID=68287 RepID=A0A3M9X3U6_9HYPH|nr:MULTISPECIES: hypothetical protein [Mesorhizobium]RNJ42689.1 hypothetical protein DNR46_26510 [Mesorhizobium japonicum]RXT42555.1 hypothetical protein B5V01_21890 [Mesorhizobium erdmanii]